MKLTKKDKDVILSMGYSESSFWQIEEATLSRNTKYELDETPIKRDEAIHLLGRENYLSGICRSAFHGSAVRETPDGKTVYFDSHQLFR